MKNLESIYSTYILHQKKVPLYKSLLIMNKNKTFEEFAISDEIVTALTSLRYFHPTKVQEEVIPCRVQMGI